MWPQGKLLATINNRVQLYGWAQREGGARELAAECGHSGHVCAVYMETRGDFILVGEAASQHALALGALPAALWHLSFLVEAALTACADTYGALAAAHQQLHPRGCGGLMACACT